MASMIYAPASCSWELSPVYRHASSTVFFPASLLVVSTHQQRVILRRSDTLEIQRTWTLPVPAQRPTATATPTAAKPLRERNSSSVARPASPTTHKAAIEAPLLTHLSISPNEPHHIVVYAPKLSTAWVLSIESGEPIARLEIGAEGCAAIAWSPDGSRLLAWSGNHIRLTVYDLTEPRQSVHILSPKLIFPLGISHSPTQPSIFALVERHNSRDVIAIYHSRPQTTTLINSFQLPSHTSDVADLAFSPCGRHLAVWEHAVNDLIVHIYSKSGQLLKTFAPYSSTNLGVELKHGASGNTQDEEVDEPKKRMLEKELRRQERLTEGWIGMGVRSIRWHPSGEYLAIGGWDGKIRILSRLGWRPMAELLHPVKVPSSVAVFEEPSSWISRTLGHGIVPCKSDADIFSFETPSTPFNPPSVRPDLDRPMPQLGVKHLAWSKSGEWLASHNRELENAGGCSYAADYLSSLSLPETYPTALWIFSFSAPASSPDGDSTETRTIRPTLHSLIVHDTAVTSFEWSASPNLPEELAIATGTKSFTTWRGPDPRSTSSKACVEGVGIPARNVDFQANGLKFSMDGQELLLHDRTMFVVAYPVADEQGPEMTFSVN
ncbi:BZ3500_MvSof-1268-A1-R1_Chr2-2g05000 [Microbotryum saponariae]|uniref:BZ3500_MvSof-1268-A1-R1_Chr2-2g05000 protein n=1 Tax=Microbotryum saponariae TaxID=289078 RepID=A0A2X0N783_9BASI|nr:BZ3500_MvSof-1268-A1-R1_Chr2-2g05000 [Microbotryum saponariae]SDA00677.1 BZ3501_MvSof-1269-A2-R1_Chr2-2g04674 [Microbotryum saponariae]